MANDANRNDPRLDLTIERTIDAPRALIWKAWTDPEHVRKWWAPAPWMTPECQIDLRPGGIFRTVMRSPEGQNFLHVCCLLELVENERLVWTTALEPGYRPAREGGDPADCASLVFTAIFTLAERGGKTHYAVRVLHKDEEGRKRHEEMGFNLGWNQCLDQLAALVEKLKA